MAYEFKSEIDYPGEEKYLSKAERAGKRRLEKWEGDVGRARRVAKARKKRQAREPEVMTPISAPTGTGLVKQTDVKTGKVTYRDPGGYVVDTAKAQAAEAEVKRYAEETRKVAAERQAEVIRQRDVAIQQQEQRKKEAERKKAQLLEQVKQTYRYAEQEVSKKIPTIQEIATVISDPLYEQFYAKLSPEQLAKEMEKLKKFEKVIRVPGQIGYGIYQSIQEKPIKAVATTAAFAALPFAMAGIGVGAKAIGVTAILAKIPTITKVGATAIRYGLPALYGTSVLTRIAAASNPEAAWKIYSKEIVEKGVPEGHNKLNKDEFTRQYSEIAISKGETFPVLEKISIASPNLHLILLLILKIGSFFLLSLL